jgi:hypothetical protein
MGMCLLNIPGNARALRTLAVRPWTLVVRPWTLVVRQRTALRRTYVPYYEQ